VSGSISVTGSLAYAAQEPWVFAGTVQENILFGRPLDPDWYDRVVDACALRRDLELLPYSDSTLVGDKGASLSGGQKARITLARAVYANSDIYLLDDPLSAVDAEVGRHLFERCICGILAKKTRVLVTHQLQFLRSVNHILLLDNNGNIASQGPLDTLLKSGFDFAQLLNSNEQSKSTESLRKRSRTTSEVSNISAAISLRRRSSIAAGDGSLTGNAFTLEQFPDFDEEDDEDDAVDQKTLEKRKLSAPKLQDEQSSSGTVKWSLYANYFKAGSGIVTFIVLVLSNVITQVLFTGSDYFLNFW
jgi:ATP-binding cassette subfamily C (CFTR/MRP) protein 4